MSDGAERARQQEVIDSLHEVIKVREKEVRKLVQRNAKLRDVLERTKSLVNEVL